MSIAPKARRSLSVTQIFASDQAKNVKERLLSKWSYCGPAKVRNAVYEADI